MNRIRLTFGTYNSQPVGSTNDQLETAYKNSYKPFLKILYTYPKVKAAIHYSGVLLEWFEDKHPEIILLINEMVKRHQIELIGGPFYNPVLSIIPNKDRVSQIEYLTTYIRKHFGKRPRGCWIPEKIWESTLSSNIKNSGMEYTFLDDTLFREAGVRGNDLNRVYITEDQGKYIHVFPIGKELSEDFNDPGQVVESLLKLLENGSSEVCTMMIDGNSRITADSCSKDGWFEKFFELLTENTRRIQTINPGRYIRTLGAVRKVYFPCAANRRYFKQNFTKYSESNLLYSKMMYINNLASQVKRDKIRKKNAREEIMKSQCNAPYWHNNLPGIYDNSLRKAAYKHLINAEKSTREKGIFHTSLMTHDFDFDGGDEYIYQGQYINAYVHKKGGVLFELDYLVTSWNFLDTMSRYREQYHQIEHEKNGFDSYPRNAFIDHFIEDGCNIKDFSSMNYKELGTFVNSEYSLVDLDRDRKILELKAKGSVIINRISNSLQILKTYDFKKNSILVKYKIINLSHNDIKIKFASEINFSLNETENNILTKAGNIDSQTEIDKNIFEAHNISEISIHEVKKKVTMSVSGSDNFSLWKIPVETITKRLDQIETIYQSTCFLLRWPVKIKSDKSWSTSITIKLEKK
ncbi:MAG: DUF1926 domain-containing protein [Spirochaetales bacterium]|nr:DUF1926 domain-containing protein [Spirochaetales bacterium]